MNSLNEIIFWAGTLIILYGAVAIILTLLAIVRRRDELYRKHYEEFLTQKRRVGDRVQRSTENEK